MYGFVKQAVATSCNPNNYTNGYIFAVFYPYLAGQS